MTDDLHIVPVSPAMLASQLGKPKPVVAFDTLAVGTSQMLPLDGTDLQWVRNAARHRSKPSKTGTRKLFKVMVHRDSNEVEVARLA